jgi:IclR family pca regulon transcriptional regulator
MDVRSALRTKISRSHSETRGIVVVLGLLRTSKWCVAQESNLVADELKASDDAGSAVSAFDFGETLAYTTHTIVNNDRLRSQGYALVDEILAPRLRTITVPITNFRDDVAAAMNVSVHAGRLPALIKIRVELAVML